MLAHQRQELLLARATAHGAVRVVDVAAELDVSEMTVRRDIAALAEAGLLRRVHGGAVPARPTALEPTFTAKTELAREAKTAIARAAADLVGPGASVALSAGTTTHLCALELAARGRSDLTVVTNSAPVAEAFGSAPGDRPEVVLTGGSLTPSRALVGPLAVTALASLRVDILLLGVHGLDADAGLTTPNLLEAETNRALVRSAGRVVVVTDSSSWGTVGLGRFGALDDIDALVTDENFPDSARAAVHDAGVHLTLVPTTKEAR